MNNNAISPIPVRVTAEEREFILNYRKLPKEIQKQILEDLQASCRARKEREEQQQKQNKK